MLETIATILSSAGLVISFLGVFWVYRCSGAVNSAHGLIAVVIFAFSIWQWFDHATVNTTDAHNMVTAGFVIFTALVNVFYTHYLQLQVKVNRRKKQVKINHPDRRKAIQ